MVISEIGREFFRLIGFLVFDGTFAIAASPYES